MTLIVVGEMVEWCKADQMVAAGLTANPGRAARIDRWGTPGCPGKATARELRMAVRHSRDAHGHGKTP